MLFSIPSGHGKHTSSTHQDKQPAIPTNTASTRGHLRPMVHFLHEFSTIQPGIDVTLIIDPMFENRIKQELEEHPHPHPHPHEHGDNPRIQMINVPDIGANPTDSTRMDALPNCIDALFLGEKMGSSRSLGLRRSSSMMCGGIFFLCCRDIDGLI